MRRRSERGKSKSTQKEEESPEKIVRKSHRHSRRRKKSTSSSEEGSKSPKKDVENITQPLEVQIQDIELPQDQQPKSESVNIECEEVASKSEESAKEWKEDSKFWESEASKPTQSGEDKEESSLWKVQSANGASGGEIQKLKICRQKPTESPEPVESSLRKRLSRGPRDSRSTDDSAHEESEKDTKKSRHRTHTGSRNSPLVSPTVVCDMSEGSPTKIKIINVSHINTENKEVKPVAEETTSIENNEPKNESVLEISHMSDTLDIALPSEELRKTPDGDGNKEVIDENKQVTNSESTATTVADMERNEDVLDETKQSVEEACTKTSRISPSPTPSPLKEMKEPSSGSTGDSDSSEDESHLRKVKKKRRRVLQSSVQRKLSTSASPKHGSSDSEDDKSKKKQDHFESVSNKQTEELVNNKEDQNEKHQNKVEIANNVAENNDTSGKVQLPRKRRWGSSKSTRSNQNSVLNINTDSLKSLIPDAKPVSAEELQLSVEEEEGQLDDDDDDEDEVVAMVAKEEEKQLERERQREERHKEREKEMAKQEEDRRKRQERFEKNKLDQPSSQQTSEKEAASRKILLLSDDAKKLAQSPSPPRHKPTNVLYITHLVRPFTVQQLKNLLLRTGTIAENGFWIDKIKSKCYVEYMTEDQAVETRHALHGVRWPTSNPKTLVVEFASKDDLVMAQALSEEPDVPRKSEPLNMVEGWVADQARIKERSKRAIVREWDVGKPEHPDEALEYEIKVKEKKEQERKARKERHHHSASPENEPPVRKSRRKEEDAPAKLLDDLFRKTKTSPCIYWLPLTQEQIAVKEEIRRQHMAEHERRMAELKKAELARRERERRNRK